MNRYLSDRITQDLLSKMVLLAGPRQVGKTTLALKLPKAESYKHLGYLNWDSIAFRKLLLDGGSPTEQTLVVLTGEKDLSYREERASATIYEICNLV